MGNYLNIGNDGFASMIKGRYVDKTEMISLGEDSGSAKYDMSNPTADGLAMFYKDYKENEENDDDQEAHLCPRLYKSFGCQIYCHW